MDQPRQEDPNTIDSRQLAMEMNERTAKQPQRELGEVPQGVVVPERFGNRYRFSSQVFWSTSFLDGSFGQRISDRRMGGNMHLLYLGGSQKR